MLTWRQPQPPAVMVKAFLLGPACVQCLFHQAKPFHCCSLVIRCEPRRVLECQAHIQCGNSSNACWPVGEPLLTMLGSSCAVINIDWDCMLTVPRDSALSNLLMYHCTCLLQQAVHSGASETQWQWQWQRKCHLVMELVAHAMTASQVISMYGYVCCLSVWQCVRLCVNSCHYQLWIHKVWHSFTVLLCWPRYICNPNCWCSYSSLQWIWLQLRADLCKCDCVNMYLW